MKKTVLLAEDDKFISRAFKDGLERAGFQVNLATDGIEAVISAKKEKPDIVLLDVIMPLKNGFEVITEFKADETLKSIPIVFMSNLGQDTDIQKGRDLGAIDYLIKSDCSIAEVVKKINDILKITL